MTRDDDPGSRHGLVLAPFRGLRFDPQRVRDLGAVTCPPYDVVDDQGVLRLEASDPHNAVRLILPRDAEGGPDGRYACAAAALTAWRSEGVLREDVDPTLYVYEQAAPGHLQRGLMGALRLEAPGSGVVLPHEDVAPRPVLDRTRLMHATRANLEPILLVYDGGGEASEVVEATTLLEPLLDASAPDGSRHRMWAVTDRTIHRRIAADLVRHQALIADGHHRYAAYLRLQELARGHGEGSGWDFGLACLVDSTRHPLEVRAIHRAVEGLSLAEAVGRARGHAVVHELTDASAVLAAIDAAGPDAGVLGLSDGVAGWLLELPPARSDVLVGTTAVARVVARNRRLDTEVLHDWLLPEVWNIRDEARVTYHHEPRQVLDVSGPQSLAVLLSPVGADRVRAAAAVGERLPRKSTSFGPKPRTGFVLRAIDDPVVDEREVDEPGIDEPRVDEPRTPHEARRRRRAR